VIIVQIGIADHSQLNPGNFIKEFDFNSLFIVRLIAKMQLFRKNNHTIE
jgi:hypothetical protein